MFEGEGYLMAKIVFQKGIALTYLIAFTVALKQYTALVGENGLLPISDFVEDKNFSRVFSIFYFFRSDTAIKTSAFTGIILSFSALAGLPSILGEWSHWVIWSSMWFLFLSFRNTGQKFYSSGSCLAEAGFLAIFLLPGKEVPALLVLLFRWFLFRMMFGAGLIKLKKDDKKWKDLTALNYFYKTQMLPNPLSKYFHMLPTYFKKLGVLFNHFVLLVIPFLFFFPQPYASIAGGFALLHQLLIVLSGNFYWLNLLTISTTIFTFSDEILSKTINLSIQNPEAFGNPGLVLILAALIGVRSIPATYRMLFNDDFNSKSYSPLRIVNTYGRYSIVREEKKEVIIKGFRNEKWEEYLFQEKTSGFERPRFISPYTHRLDSLLWFVAHKTDEDYDFLDELLEKLLEGDDKIESLFKFVPFDEPPEKVKAEVYRYKFSDGESYWEREKIESLGTKSREDFS